MNNTELYHKHNSLQTKDAIETLEEFTRKINWHGADRVIDIGCGDGSVTTNVLKKFIPGTHKKVAGCDKSEKMVYFANKLYSDGKTEFFELDIESDLPRELHGTFDHVFSFYVLHWVKQQKKAFRNIYNLLEEGGDCLLVFLGYMPLYDVYQTLARNNKWATWLQDVYRFISPYHDCQDPEKKVRKIMEQTGFNNIDVQCKEKWFTFDSLESVKKAVAAVNPFQIPGDLNEEFLADYAEVVKSMNMLDKLNNNGHKPVKFSYKLIVAFGTK